MATSRAAAGATTRQLMHTTPAARNHQPEAPAAPHLPDPFTTALQQKTQQQLLQLLHQKRQAAQEEAEEEGQEQPADGAFVNPDTGEEGGYRGKEPTRFGDWEHKGRCTDFS